MSKLVKIIVIVAVATVAIAATRMLPGETPAAPALSGTISPMEMMRDAGPLPETKVDHYQ